MKNSLQKIGIIVKMEYSPWESLITRVFEKLVELGKEIFLDKNAAQILNQSLSFKKSELMEKVDLVLVFGGDGTVLKTARKIATNSPLILPVNIGNLGFLSECSGEDVFGSLEKVFVGDFFVDERNLVEATIISENTPSLKLVALNEVVINQGAFARLLRIGMHVGDVEIGEFKADGLIVATPTGSTGHALSAGGPIVSPRVEAFVLAPICPSALTMRPIILPDEEEIFVRILNHVHGAKNQIGVTIDGQDIHFLAPGDRVKIAKSQIKVRIARTRENYYQSLRQKLKWGKD